MLITARSGENRFSSDYLWSMQSTARLLIIVLSCLLASGCAYFKKDKDGLQDASAEEIYSSARESMGKNNWETALEQLRALEAKYPYGIHAVQAQIDTVYIHYRTDQTGLALAAADRFIKLRPTHASVDYIYYLKGLSSFDEDQSFLSRLLGYDDLSDRDATPMYEAMAAFEEVYTRFPDSQYAPDARMRAKHLLESIAKNEIAVANYYYSREAHVAAVNRAREIVENYASTPSVEQALALMMFSYQDMGLDDLSSDTRSVLELNFPDSKYLDQGIDSSDFFNKYSPEANRKKKKDRTGWFSSLMDRFRKQEPAAE